MVDVGRGVLDCTGEEVEGVDDTVAFADCWLGEVLVQELDGVGEQECLGGAIDDVEAAVMFECGSNVEPDAAAEVPSFADDWFVVDDNGASNWSQRGVIKVEGAVEVLPCRHCWVESGLSEEVESVLGLGEEMIPEKVGEQVGNSD